MDWKRKIELADQAVAYREVASEVKAKAGQTIVADHSLSEVQSPDYVKNTVDWKFNTES